LNTYAVVNVQITVGCTLTVTIAVNVQMARRGNLDALLNAAVDARREGRARYQR
jgi:hypothetical protein